MENQNQAQVASGPITTVVNKTKLTVVGLNASMYQKAGTITAQLVQEVTTKSSYPSARPVNSMDVALFSQSEYGLPTQDYENKEKRVHFQSVPVGTTLEEVQKRIDAMPDATLVRHLSNRPILTPEQNQAISNGITTMDKIADSQVVRYPDGHEKRGQIILDSNGKVQYRAISLSDKNIEDNDLRNSDKADQYMTPTIMAELQGASVIANQTL